MDIKTKIEDKKREVKSNGILMSANLALSIERETMMEKLEELENRVIILEKK